MKRAKTVALYARVSTSDQTAAGQLHALRAYGEGREEDAAEFVDEGVSGAKASRPALDEMLAAARRRELSAIVVTKLDRIGRSSLHLAKAENVLGGVRPFSLGQWAGKLIVSLSGLLFADNRTIAILGPGVRPRA
jgi:predicted site-specific integrase-resolvase